MVKLDEACACPTLTFLPERAIPNAGVRAAPQTPTQPRQQRHRAHMAWGPCRAPTGTQPPQARPCLPSGHGAASMRGNWACLGPWQGGKDGVPAPGCSVRGAALPGPIPGMRRACLELHLLTSEHIFTRQGGEGSFCGKTLRARQEGNSPGGAAIARGLRAAASGPS